jgi:basic membrane protein A
MSANEYLKAQKLGEKRYQAAVAKNEYPYLPVLDEIISPSDTVGEVNLGLQTISLDRVVGTATAARTTAFASNFMPILDYHTEFGAKWSALCASHIEEGIHDPIKVYEYMNKFYVIEGNKRVSVLKYFGADSVPAMVTRKIPRKNDSIENKVYYEFMDFHKQTGINYVHFSQTGGYDKLREFIGLDNDRELSDDERLDFNSAHLAFERAYLAKKGSEELTITIDDAMLVFLNVYGYEALKKMSSAEVKDSVEKVWTEIVLSSKKKEQVVLPKLDPVEPKKSILGLVIKPAAPSNLKVAFVYDKTPASSVWTYCHELGRLDMQNKLGDAVDSSTFCNVDTQAKLVECLNKLVDEKYDVIFTTGPEMLPEALKVAVLHPDIKILNCSLSLANSHVRTYYARMYEVKFITGMIAGSLCADGQIGYVADYPIFGTTANINAFAIGARMVNPRAKIYLQWTKVKGANPQKFFEKNGITYISDRDMIMPDDASRNFGLYHYDQNGDVVNLAMPFYNWGAFYERILRSILDGNWKQEEKSETANAVSYWWGMSAGIVDVICSKHLPAGTQKLISVMTNLIREGAITPFSGKLTSQNGVVRNEDDGAMLHEDILKMDWLAENIVGMLPTAEDLVDEARTVVALQGVDTPESLELKSVPDVK